MTDAIETTRHFAKLGERRVLVQEARVARQSELLASLERGGHEGAAVEGRVLLRQMLQLLLQMRQDHAAAKQLLSDLTHPLDEKS